MLHRALSSSALPPVQPEHPQESRTVGALFLKVTMAKQSICSNNGSRRRMPRIPASKVMTKRNTHLLLLSVLAFTCSASGQTTDRYGGRIDVSCTRKTGRFHTEKIGSRWWLCTPEGHGFFFQGVGAWNTPNTRKFGNDRDTAARSLLDEFTSWGFNAVGEKTFGVIEPINRCAGCKQLPELQTLEMNARALFNGEHYASSSVHPVKNIVWGTNSDSHIYYFKPLIDVFDRSDLSGYLAALFEKDSGFKRYAASPYFVALAPGDSDYLIGFGAGPDFDAAGYGGNHNDTDLGRVVLVTSPMQSFDHSATQGNFSGDMELYTDTKVYSKTAMASPPASCSIVAPCSLRDYLYQKYGGSISALNAAWGSNYTTFDSSGTGRSQSICVGALWDGSKTTCSDAFASLNISPYSVQVFVDGILQAGDCPWFALTDAAAALHGCGRLSNDTGYLGGLSGNTIAATSTINYKTGAISINFKLAPSAGRHAITVTYAQNGWMYGTGLMDEDGRHSWTGTNAVCLLPVNGGGPGTPSWACRRDNPSGWGPPNANANLARDLEDWVGQFAAEYFGTVNNTLKAAAPQVLFLGMDIVGGWYQPANSNILKGAAGDVDILFTQVAFSPDDQPTSGITTQASLVAANNYITQYYGDHPLMNFVNSNANADSAMAPSHPDSPVTFSSQARRGTGWYNIVNTMLNTPSYNNTYQWVGIVWWGSHDFNNYEKTNFGLKTPSDNAYDGHEDVAAIVPCSPPLEKYTCGGEKRDYGDVVTWVKKANHLWLELASPKP